jgi:hypothetical protein
MTMPLESGLNQNVYQHLGIRTIIDASGPSTRLSGGVMRPEVAEAMAEAAQWCVDLAELQGRASEILAQVTGPRRDMSPPGPPRRSCWRRRPALHSRSCENLLPRTTGMANEVVMGRSQRNMYDHAVAQAGAIDRSWHSRSLLRRRCARCRTLGVRGGHKLQDCGDPVGRAAAFRTGPEGARQSGPPSWRADNR